MRRTLAGFIAFLAMTGTSRRPARLRRAAAGGPPGRGLHRRGGPRLGDRAQRRGGRLSTDGGPQPGGVTPEEAAVPPTAEPSQAPALQEKVAEDAAGGRARWSPSEQLPGVPALTYAEPDTEKFSSVGRHLAAGRRHRRRRPAAGEGRRGPVGRVDHVSKPTTSSRPRPARPGDKDRAAGQRRTGPATPTASRSSCRATAASVPEDVSVALIDPGESAADALPRGPRPAGPGVPRGHDHARHHHARRSGGPTSRSGPGTRVRTDAEGGDPAPHRRPQQLHRSRRLRDDAVDLRLPHADSWLGRHRVQLRRRQVRPHLRGPLRRA